MINNKFSNLICLFLLNAFISFDCNCSAESLKSKSSINRWLGTLTSSEALLFFENKIIGKIYNLICPRFFGNYLATDIYQKLGKEAQFAVGIPLEYHVYIKKFSPLLNYFFNNSALTIPGAIYVNQNQLDRLGYGVKRCTLFHEAVHRKYNDLSFLLIFSTAWIGLFALIDKCISSYKINKFTRYIGYFLCLVLLHRLCIKRFERRADIESLFSIKCSCCVKELSLVIDDDYNSKNGYLCTNDLEEIVEDLEVTNEKCSCHSTKSMNVVNKLYL